MRILPGPYRQGFEICRFVSALSRNRKEAGLLAENAREVHLYSDARWKRKEREKEESTGGG